MVRGISVNFLEQHFCSQQNHISREVQFVSDIQLYKTARGLCCNITVLNVHSPTEVKSEEINNNYAKLEQAFKATKHFSLVPGFEVEPAYEKFKKHKSPITIKFHQNQYKTQCKILHLEIQNPMNSV